jgi:hypothetical protein
MPPLAGVIEVTVGAAIRTGHVTPPTEYESSQPVDPCQRVRGMPLSNAQAAITGSSPVKVMLADVAPRKAESPMVAVPSPSVSEVSSSNPRNASKPICVTESGITRVVSSEG